MTTTTAAAHAQVHTYEFKWTKPEIIDWYEFFVDGSPIKWRLKLESLGIDYDVENDELHIWRVQLEAAIPCYTHITGGDCTIGGKTAVQITHSYDKTNDFKCNFVKQGNEIQKNYSQVCEYGNVYTWPTAEADITLTCTVKFFKLYDMIPWILPDEYATTSSNMSTFHLGASFEDVYLSEKHSDVTLCVNGNRYPAHKVILEGCSKVFAAMFEHDMKENNQNVVEIKDISEQVFLETLHYVYTGKAKNVDTLACDLLPVADRYDIVGLKELCETVLSKQLSVGTIANIMVLADSCNAENLRARSIKFYLERSKDVARQISADDWQRILARPKLNKDLMILLSEK